MGVAAEFNASNKGPLLKIPDGKPRRSGRHPHTWPSRLQRGNVLLWPLRCTATSGWSGSVTRCASTTRLGYHFVTFSLFLHHHLRCCDASIRLCTVTS